jgi:hypothetical protein
MSANDKDKNEEGGARRPPPRNPFARPEERDFEPQETLIEGKRMAAISGVLIGLALAILVAAICIVGAIAFAD